VIWLLTQYFKLISFYIYFTHAQIHNGRIDFHQILHIYSLGVILKTSTRNRVCVVAQYAVLEANAKVNGRSQISYPHRPKSLTDLDGNSNISLRPPREWNGCAKCGGNLTFNTWLLCYHII